MIEHDKLKFCQEIFGNGLGNPRRLPNVHNLLFDNEFSPYYLKGLIDAVTPDLIIGKHYQAPYLLKTQRPDIEIWVLPSSCSQIRNGIY